MDGNKKLSDRKLEDLVGITKIINECFLVRTQPQLVAVFQDINQYIPFKYAIAAIANINADGSYKSMEHIINISYPEAWLKHYKENGYQETDPVLIDHFKQYDVQCWSETLKRCNEKPEAKRLMAAIKKYGLYDGISFGKRDSVRHLSTMVSLNGLAAESVEWSLKLAECLTPALHFAILNIDFSSNTNVVLTKRERQVLSWIVKGKSNWEVSKILNISESTVKFHLINLFKKLEVDSRSAAIAVAIRSKLVELNPHTQYISTKTG